MPDASLRPEISDSLEQAREIVHAWIRDHAPTGIKLTLRPSITDPLIAAIAASLTSAAEDWRPRPISDLTPKQSDRVLAWSPAYGGFWFVARYNSDKNALTPKPFWYLEGEPISFSRANQPTHFLPLPKPPTDESQAAADTREGQDG